MPALQSEDCAGFSPDVADLSPEALLWLPQTRSGRGCRGCRLGVASVVVGCRVRSSQQQGPLADYLMRQALLRLLCGGLSRTKAATACGFNVRTLQRYVAKEGHKGFAKAVERAVEFGSSEARVDPRFVESLVAGEVDEGPPGGPELPTDDEIDMLENDAIDAEVVESAPKVSEGLDPDDPFFGLPAFGERELLAFSWRAMNDSSEGSTIRAVHARCLYQHLHARTRRDTLMNLRTMASGGGQPAGGERGLTEEAVREFRRLVIGPPPGPPEADEDVG